DAPLVASGGSTSISWNVQRADGQATLEGPTGSQQVTLPNGKITVSPDQNAEYKLTAKNMIGFPTTGTTRGQVLRRVGVTAATDALKQPGDPVTLQWSTENASSVTIEPADEIPSPPPTNGRAIVHPQTSTVYKLTATNDAAKAQATAEARASFSTARITQFQQDKQQVFP